MRILSGLNQRPELVVISVSTLYHYTTGDMIYLENLCYMSPAAYLRNMFKPIGYRTCYICLGPVFRCEFNGDVRFMIRLTKYGNFPKYGSVYMFQAPFFKENSTITVIM